MYFLDVFATNSCPFHGGFHEVQLHSKDMAKRVPRAKRGRASRLCSSVEGRNHMTNQRCWLCQDFAQVPLSSAQQVADQTRCSHLRRRGDACVLLMFGCVFRDGKEKLDCASSVLVAVFITFAFGQRSHLRDVCWT